MTSIRRFTVLLLLFAAILSSCAPGSQDRSLPPQDQIATKAAATLQAIPTSQAPTKPTTLLPRSLYYLSDPDGNGAQVWRMEADGITTTQLTTQPGGVLEYAVSAASGRLAYITGNQLYLADPDGSPASLVVDGSGADQTSDEFLYRLKLSGLSWSLDGSLLAYGQNGVHLYRLDDQTDQHVLPNEIETIENGPAFPVSLYSPAGWSPDGQRLLVEIGYFDGGSLGIFTPASGAFLPLGEGIICCQPAWAPDSQSLLVASPYLGMIDSGLWRFNANTGERAVLIPTTSEDATLNFVGWPLELPNGDLRYFYANTAAFPESDTPLLLVSAGLDALEGRTILRPESWIIYEALWAEDGSFVVTIQPTPGLEPGWPRSGPIVLIPLAGTPEVPLAANGYHLRWGP